MVFSIIMLVCLIVCVGIDYLSLKRIERNGALLGVTLPQNAAELPEVQDIVQRYLRRLRTICLLCAAVSVGLFFAPNSLFYVTVWVYFFFGSLALPYLPVCGGTALCKNCGMPTAGLPRPRTPHGNTVCSIMTPTTSASPFPNVSAKEALSISPPSGVKSLWRSMSLQSSAFCWLGRCWAFSTTPPQGWNCKCRPR